LPDRLGAALRARLPVATASPFRIAASKISFGYGTGKTAVLARIIEARVQLSSRNSPSGDFAG
jgi:hypothetical protein